MTPRWIVLLCLLSSVASLGAMITGQQSNLAAQALHQFVKEQESIAPPQTNVQIETVTARKLTEQPAVDTRLLIASPFDPMRKDFERFTPEIAPKVYTPSPKLLGIVRRDGKFVALLELANGETQTVKPGDSMESWTVKRVEETRVVLSSTGDDVELGLFDDDS